MKEKPYIKISTKGMDRASWLRLRKSGIGGSEAASVCGCSPWESPLGLFYEKTSDKIDLFENESTKLGNLLEDACAKRFEEEAGLVTRKSNAMYRSVKYPWMTANVDRLIVGENAGLEVKVASQFNADQWKDGKVPIHYLLQCFHYMIVLQRKVWYICVMVLGRDFIWRKIEWDDEIANNLIAIEESFWKEHVMKKIEPSPDGSVLCGEAIRRYMHTAKEKHSVPLIGFDEKLHRREELMDQIEKLDVQKRQIEQELQLFMQDAELACSDKYRVSWANVSTTRLNTKAIQREHPDIYNKFLTTTISRRFTVKAA